MHPVPAPADRVVVVGPELAGLAGLTGLRAALRLAGAGREVEVEQVTTPANGWAAA